MRAVGAPACHPDRKYYARGLCGNCYMRDFRRARPEYRAYMKEYLRHYATLDYVKQRDKERNDRRRQDPQYRQSQRRWNHAKKLRSYGLTQATYDELFSIQGGKCAICLIPLAQPSPTRSDSAVIDHDHKTGLTRGILCNTCNTALGGFKDSIKVLEQAMSYLRKASRSA